MRAIRSGKSLVTSPAAEAPPTASMEIPFEDQLLAFEARLAKQGLASALELLNDRTKFRYTALHRLRGGNLLPVCVFDRFNENRAYLQSAQFLAALGAITVEAGDFVTSDCSQDVRLKPLGGLIISYCGVVLAPVDGPACGVLCHFDIDSCEVRPCELSFLRAVAPLLVHYVE